MSHSILVSAERETARGLQLLIGANLPEGFQLADGSGARGGLNVDPVSVALIGAAGSIVSSLITALATVWVERMKRRQEQRDRAAEMPSEKTTIPTITIVTHKKEITIRLLGSVEESIAGAEIPEDPAQIVEVNLGSE